MFVVCSANLPSCVTNTCICVYSDDQYPQRNKIFAQYANRCGLVNGTYYNFYLTFNLMQDWEESCIRAWVGIGTAEICRMVFNCFYHHRNINNWSSFCYGSICLAALYIYFSTIIIQVFAPGK